VPVSEVIERVGLKPAARYLMFYCADSMNVGDPESKYYESIGMDEALHPQTILVS
jgi:DMSO/TMAO reductase YedYZ molybdopterin-dependent catalytic subunit